MSTATTGGEKEHTSRARRNLTYLLLFSIVMLFAGLSSAYVVSKGGAAFWVHITIPAPFYWSTASILLSSVFVQLALVAARKGRKGAVAPFLLLGLALGIGFAVGQWKGWKQLTAAGQYLSFSNVLQPTGEYGKDYVIEHKGVILERVDGRYYMPDDTAHARPLNAEMTEAVNGASQFFVLLVWVHLAHLFGGLIALVFMGVKALLGRYGPKEHTGLWQGVLYWHFLAGLWVYLLSFLAFVH